MKTTRALLIATVAAFAPTVVAPAEQLRVELPRYVDDLNLGFESSDATGRPLGWFAGGEGYSATVDAAEQKDGARSLRLERLRLAPGANAFGVATGRFPVEDARGGRLRLTGWIRTGAVDGGWAGLWMRVDGPGSVLAFDNMQARGIRGTTPWSLYEIVLEVPREATNVNFGALLTGSGVAWVDALRFEVLPAAAPVTVTGTVRGADGRAVPQAWVTLGPTRRQHARTDADGGFSIEAMPGEYALTATAAGHQAGAVPRQAVEVDRVIDVRLGAGGHTVSGRVLDDAGAPVAGVPVGFTPSGAGPGQAWFTPTDASGRYSLTLPEAGAHTAIVDSANHLALPVPLPPGQQALDIPVVRRGEVPTDVVEWVRAAAVPLASVEPGRGLDDMEPLRALVADARVVALGEATHGSREFFQLKHRVLEFLVERMGFSVFAIEANWPEALALDEYVRTGRGDPRAGLAGIYFWTWNTEEVLALVEWMRAWNADPAHTRKLRFYGFDMQAPFVAADRVAEYVRHVEPADGGALVEPLEPARDRMAAQRLRELTGDRQDALRKSVAELLARFEAQRPAWVARSSEQEWLRARQHLVIVRQALDSILPGGGPGRDASMAENVRWLLEQEPAGTRMMLWAHNGHIARAGTGPFKPMGAFLSESLGSDYLAVGLAFGRGSFQAIDWSQGQGRPGTLAEHAVGTPPADSLDAAFERTGLPQFALDLRSRGGAPLPRWFSVPRAMREIGAVFTSAEAMVRPVVLPRAYDAVIFVRQTTRARPVTATKPTTPVD